METEERSLTGSNHPEDQSRSQVDPEQAERYELYVKKAKQEAKSGNLSKSIEFFLKAREIHPSEKINSRIEKLQEALQQLELQEEQDDEFIDVLNSGFMIYNELYNKLFEHQKEGVAFLYSLYRDGRKGGILADDMGLGKTIQVIAFLSGMFDAELTKCALLVMPTTLISNWMKEFMKWTPGMRVAEFHGASKKERTRNLEKIQRKGGIIITTYQMLINNWQQLSSYNEREFEWDYIILDEAHKIKTSSTKTAKSCHSIPAKNRILLTGTPIQNNLREMWALYDFACQGTLLGTSKTFKMEYENPITRAREKDATPGEKALGLKISENLMKIIQPYFLRRTKSEVQHKKTSGQPTREQDKSRGPSMPSLTRKNDFIVWVYLSTIQEEVYRKFISLDQIKELLMTTRSPLAELTILKKLCDHPRLLSARACIQLGLEGDDYHSNEEGDHEAVTKFDHLSDEILIEESGKLMLLIDLLHKLRDEGHRTLVFSQSRKMLDMIDRILYNNKFKVMRIDGTVSLPEREKRISMFQSNNNYSVLLLTTQVGGVGLTLTAADRVVIFDPSWNPATDAQAVDRAYRIGQQENVVIYRLITCGTVEEKIYRRQIFKESLIRQTTGDKKNPFRYFSKQELKELFSLEDTRTSSTQIQLQNMHAAERKTDTRLDEHIAYLHTLQIFGISDHDLVYSNELSSQEDYECENEHDDQYIEQRVQKAHELVQMESQLNEQLMDQIRKGTEGAWLRQIPTAPEKPKQRSLPKEKHSPPPVTVDLTEDDVGEVSCVMTSLVINDSSGEEDEDLPAAPFSTKPLNENSHSCDTSHATGPLKLENSLQKSPEKIFSVQEEIIDCDSSVIETDDKNTPSFKDDSSDPAPSVTEHVSYSQPTKDSDIPIWHVEPEIANKLRQSFGNRTEELQESCGPDMDMKDGLEASLSASKSHLPCDFNLVLDDSMERDECNVSMEGLECAMEISVAADKNAILVLEDSVENTSQRNVLAISMNSEKGDMVVVDDSMDNTSLRNALAASDKRALLVLENSFEDLNPEGDISETSMKLELKKNLNESMETADIRIKDSPFEEDIKTFHVGEGPETGNNELQASVHSDSEEELVFVSKKKTAKRIYSDSEDETSVYVDENDKVFSPFSSPSSVKGITASTPKLDKSISDSLFPLRKSLGRRRSIASRRSLVHVAVEEAADVNDTIQSSSAEESGGEEDEFITSEAEEAEEEESVQTEEEPVGETLPHEESISQHSEYYESDSFIVKSSSGQEEGSSSDESTGEDLLPGEQIDYLALENANLKGDVSLSEDPYITLVNRGKRLMDAGKWKEALDCFLEALDIKPGDPEIMMITLNLYRQQPR
ncbi:DNA excision repair protein ERCC-6-like [Xenopus laevis]|uniref:DNA excision repair protein ERCC-6-like n=2 Tax=Xenopus laevis TaxID=8355 RepID=A0A1L8F6K3_XENLA|nr:DNA excision repair protein ERCC-6-like [Xenopus laevis]OCT67216.1 hypothetical protein XELAEV_18038499mg [Xenopus laevis]